MIFDCSSEKKEDFACGLACGLAGGLAWGLACGLAWVLVGGLVSGLVGGLVCGLAWGLGGLTGGLTAIGTITAFSQGQWWVLIPIIALAELLFYLDKKKPAKKENTFWFTAKRKVQGLLEAAWVVLSIKGAYDLIPIVSQWLGENQELTNEIACFVGYGIATITIIAILGYAWIKANSLKYGGKVSGGGLG